MADFEREEIIHRDPLDPTLDSVRERRVVVGPRSDATAPWLVLASVAIVCLVLLILFEANSNTPSSEPTSAVLGTHVTPTTMNVDVTPAPPVQNTTVTAPMPAVTVAAPTPQPARTVVKQVPGPTRVITQQVPGPVRTVAVPVPAATPAATPASQAAAPAATPASTPAMSQSGSQSSNSVAMGTQIETSGTIENLDADTLTIRHRGAMHLDAGTDTFKLKDDSLAQSFSSGDDVNIVLQRTEDGWQVVGMTRVAH